MNIEQARTEAGGWTPDLIARHAVSAHDTIRRLLAEVERLTQANKSAHERWEAEVERADVAEAALARVTGPRFVPLLSEALGDDSNGDPNGAPPLFGGRALHPAQAREIARAVAALVRTVASGAAGRSKGGGI